MTNPLLDPNARLVIAHRGNSVGAPENTLESLRAAMALGADALEFDVRLSRDGVPVVMHDPDLGRTTNGHGLVASYSTAELRTLDAAARSRFSGGHRHVIPTLEEVFEALLGVPFVIEVKELAAVDATAALVRRFSATERVVLGSAYTSVVERFYRTGLPTCASMVDALRLMPFAWAGITPARPKYDVLSLTQRFHGVPIPVIRLAAAARKAGIATQVWTVNDPDNARELWLGGVAGIVTDDPAALIRARAS